MAQQYKSLGKVFVFFFQDIKENLSISQILVTLSNVNFIENYLSGFGVVT
jgi:hypothetical protein